MKALGKWLILFSTARNNLSIHLKRWRHNHGPASLWVELYLISMWMIIGSVVTILILAFLVLYRVIDVWI